MPVARRPLCVRIPAPPWSPLVKRVLFVDDEPQVLTMLTATMAPLRSEWEMEFVPSGEQALASLERQPADVVLADIHLVGMGGLQLLGEVKARYPQTVRLAFSGCAHQELILKGLGVAHQVLPKPLAPAALQATISQVSARQEMLNSPALQQLVGSIQHLPSLPSLYQELEATMAGAAATAEKAAAIIAKDPAMVTNLLHVVNSAYFSLRRTITSPAHAVALLGLPTVKSLVLSLKVCQEAQRTPALTPIIERLWQHGVTVGRMAKALAVHEGMGSLSVEQAFLAGLMHDIGKLVLASNLPQPYAEWQAAVQQGGGASLDVEQQVFGATHAEVGGYLLSMWGLPAPIVEAVAFHHRPAAAHTTGFTILTAIHLANAWQAGDSAPGSSEGPDAAYLTALGFADRTAQWEAQCRAVS